MEKIVFDAGWIKVKQTPVGYYFSERKGVDSLAVLCYRKNLNGEIEVLTRLQAIPINKSQENDDKEVPELFRCPITGGMEEGVSIIRQARVELIEEAGIDIPEAGFSYLDEYYVGTQTNEKVHMFIVDFDTIGTELVDITGDGSYLETIGKNEWMPLDTLLDTKYSGLNIMVNKLTRMSERGEI